MKRGLRGAQIGRNQLGIDGTNGGRRHLSRKPKRLKERRYGGEKWDRGKAPLWTGEEVEGGQGVYGKIPPYIPRQDHQIMSLEENLTGTSPVEKATLRSSDRMKKESVKAGQFYRY